MAKEVKVTPLRLVVFVFGLMGIGIFLSKWRLDTAPRPHSGVPGTAQFAVFHLIEAKTEPGRALYEATFDAGIEIYPTAPPPTAKAPFIVLRSMSTRQYAVPSRTLIEQSKTLIKEQAQMLPLSAQVSALDATMTSPEQLRAVEAAIARFAEATGGVVWDEETYELFSREIFERERIRSWTEAGPDLDKHVVVFENKEPDGTVLRRTGGLIHFGLEELESTTKDSKALLDEARSRVAAMVGPMVVLDAGTP